MFFLFDAFLVSRRRSFLKSKQKSTEVGMGPERILLSKISEIVSHTAFLTFIDEKPRKFGGARSFFHSPLSERGRRVRLMVLPF